jgi:Flp pilus assembly protein TadD
MCRKPRLAASLLLAGALIAPVAAQAAPAPAKAPAPAAAAAAVVAPATAAPAPPKKADAATRAAAERMEPLSRAAFWANELQVDPTDTYAGVRLSASLRALGRYDEAADAAQRVLVLKPDDVEALFEDARAKIAGGQAFYAIAPLERARGLVPNDWRSNALLGVAYAEVKRPADSQAAYAAALRLSPDNPSVLSNMAMTLAASGDAAGAESLLRKAAAQPGSTIKERQNLALVLGYQGKLAEAEQLIRRDLPPELADANLAFLKDVARAN